MIQDELFVLPYRGSMISIHVQFLPEHESRPILAFSFLVCFHDVTCENVKQHTCSVAGDPDPGGRDLGLMAWPQDQ